jgi:hypothetical protein
MFAKGARVRGQGSWVQDRPSTPRSGRQGRGPLGHRMDFLAAHPERLVANSGIKHEGLRVDHVGAAPVFIWTLRHAAVQLSTWRLSLR